MSVIIKGMEMPREGCHHLICIYADGTVSTGRKTYRAEHIQPHGDLIERKAAYDSILSGMVMTGCQSRALDCIDEIYVPTIIPAEEGET